MTAITFTAGLHGLDAYPVEIIATRSEGPAELRITGVTDTAARETRVRIVASLASIGVALRTERLIVTVSAPVDVGADLAIAVAILAELGRVPTRIAAKLAAGEYVLHGELSLSGNVRPVRGLLAKLYASFATPTTPIVPVTNYAEAVAYGASSDHVGQPLIVTDLRELVGFLNSENELVRAFGTPASSAADTLDLIDAPSGPGRRALEIAAAGGLNLLLIGPPGAGTTALARRLCGILPPLATEDALTVTKIHSVAGLLSQGQGLATRRPFRAPHFTVSDTGLLGGGKPTRPGEITLAHGGVLYLDEVTEFRKSALNTLRAPIAEGVVRFYRDQRDVSFPAAPLIVASSQGCPCGYAGSLDNRCHCGADRQQAYLARIPAELLRLGVAVRLPPAVARSTELGDSTATVRARVIAARRFAEERVKQGVLADSSSLAARAIADLDGSYVVTGHHVEEALQFSVDTARRPA